MDTDSSKLYSNPQVLLGPISIEAPPQDVQGKATEAIQSEQEIELSPEEAEILQNGGDEIKPVYISTDITLFGTGGKKVQVYSDDYIYVKSLATLVARIEED
jgi:hypothetical protein